MLTRHIFYYSLMLMGLFIQSSALNAQTLIISGAKLIDGTGEPPQENINIIISDGHIERVGGKAEPGADSIVINAEGFTVMPGLVDMHTHPTFEIRMEKPKLPFPDPDSLPASDTKMREFIAQRLPGRLEKFIQGGITTIVSAGSFWPYELDIRKQLTSGELRGPRLVVASPIFTAPGGHPSSGICSHTRWCSERLSYEAGTDEQAREGVLAFAKDGAEGIKLVYDSFDKRHLGGPDFNFPRLDADLMSVIVEEAHAVGLPVVAHTKTVNETADAVKAGVDALVHSALMENAGFTTRRGEHLPHLLAERNLSVTTTIRSFFERLESATAETRAGMQQNFDRVGPSLRAYSEAGVTLLFGTDFDGAGLDPDPRDAVNSEARALVAAGFDELEVIKMATGSAAKHPMIPENVGSIEAGKVADIIILKDDPLEDITAITRPLLVIQGGKIVVDKR